MGKKDNLNPPVRTASEARELGRNGGIKSGEARRRKKALREAYTKEAAFDELDELMNAAKEAGNLTAAVRLAELKGKMCGYYVDKVAKTNSEGDDVVVPIFNIIPAPMEINRNEGYNASAESHVPSDGKKPL